MTMLTLEQVDEVVANWLGGQESVEGSASPAGPLFRSGDYAEADIMQDTTRRTTTEYAPCTITNTILG